MDRDAQDQVRMAAAAFRDQPAGIQVYRPDPSGQVLQLLYANPAVDRLLGLFSAAHAGASLACVLPSAGACGLAEASLRALRDGDPVPPVEMEWIMPDLAERRLAVTLFPCLDGCVALQFEDVTGLRRAEAAQAAAAREGAVAQEHLRRSEQRLRQIAGEWTAVFDALPEWVAVIDADFTLRRVNRALARFAGCEPQDLVGRKCHEVLHGQATPWEGCPHQACLRAGAPVTGVIEDPAIGRPLRVTCAPILDLPGQAGCSVHLARDLSGQRHAEFERETLIRQLQEALAQVRLLGGLIPICAWCKRVRDDSGSWEQLEAFFQKNSQVLFTHCLCPECARKM